MGQKVNPIAFRIGVNETWSSNWFAGKDYKKSLKDDYQIREIVKKNFRNAAISKVFISRVGDKTKVQIHAAKSGVIIGKKGSEIDKLKTLIAPHCNSDVSVDVIEVKKADLSAAIVAHNIATQLEKRISFRRAMRRSILNTLRAGAKGIKVTASGRLAGAEIARAEWYREGRLRLHTLRSAVDYAHDTAFTTYGTIGVKVWIYTGERFTYRLPV